MELSRIGAGTSYSVECGSSYAQTTLSELFRTRLEHAKVAIITDREVSGYYIADFVRQFELSGIKPVVIIIDGSQASKSFDAIRLAYERLTDMEFTRKDLLIAFGGGGVIDVAGFVAATYYAGIDYIQVPTSLLAMIDSSVAESAHLNFMSHKNLIGISYSPVHVLIDTNYLHTLPPRFYANGIAEVIQYGITENPSLLSILEQTSVNMNELIDTCVRTRRIINEKNPQLLTFGQEIAEAIEGHFRFLKYTHGEALALGMYAHYSSERMKQLYVRHGLPVTVSGVTKDTLLKRIMKGFDHRLGDISVVRISQEGEPRVDKLTHEEAYVIYDELVQRICQ
jgi:3-dehydroquinate synthetase